MTIEDSRRNAAIGQSPTKADVVCIRYDDLVAACLGDDGSGSSSSSSNSSSDVDVAHLIECAFSSIGLGIIAITDVPNLSDGRIRLLRLSRDLATLPSEVLDGITVPESMYQVGWSHGREKLEGDRLDYGKGSFYANPLTEDLVETMLGRRRRRSCEGSDVLSEWEDDESIGIIGTDDGLRELASSNPAFFAPNVWPTEHLPEVESTFREVGGLIHEVGIMVAKCCDSYVSSLCPGYERKLERILRHSKCCKARLLHYFPPPEEEEEEEDSAPDDEDDQANNDNGVATDEFSDWCGWHNDHGSLTGLLPALYLDGDGNIIDGPPDVEVGLYIKSRDGRLLKAYIPENAVAFQVGETAQIHTGGLLKATPHAVRGCRGPERVSRETFAVFMEPEFHCAMDLPVGRTLEDTQCVEDERLLPSSVRTLRSRWKLGMTFGDFSNATFAAFH